MKSEMPKKQGKAKEILGEGCGGVEGDECLGSQVNSRRSAGVWNIHQDSNVRKRFSEIKARITNYILYKTVQTVQYNLIQSNLFQISYMPVIIIH